MTPDELRQARQYIIHGEGTAPVRWWWTKPRFPAQKLWVVAENADKDDGPPPDPPLAVLEQSARGD